jgi:hemerythrin-like domain-containing protein
MPDTETALVDTSDMVRFHRIFRQAFSQVPRLVNAVPPGDRRRADLVADYYANVLRLLHAHHTGEDELLMPRLIDRHSDPELVRSVAGQHEGVSAGLVAAEAALAAFRERPEPDTAAALTAGLRTVGDQVIHHLDDEEAILLPIAARCLTPAEWAQLPENGLRHFDGDKFWLVLGLIRRQLTDDEVADMDAHLPPPVAESWSAEGRPAFEAFVAELGV